MVWAGIRGGDAGGAEGLVELADRTAWFGRPTGVDTVDDDAVEDDAGSDWPVRRSRSAEVNRSWDRVNICSRSVSSVTAWAVEVVVMTDRGSAYPSAHGFHRGTGRAPRRWRGDAPP